MRKFTVEEPVELNRNNDNPTDALLTHMYNKIQSGEIVKTGSNASQTAGQEGYVEILAQQLILDPYAPYIYLDKKFQTPKKYVKSELDWYKSMDLSIIGHPGIEDNPTWQSCCTQDDKKLVNSNYGWCVFSEENGSQYDNCLATLIKDKTTRNAIIMYERPSMYADYKKDGMHDMICTFFSHFFIRDNKLYMVHVMRSNDIRYGFICSDLAWNCFVYQNMYEDLKKVYPDLEVGCIVWQSDSMHLYSRHFDDLKAYIGQKFRQNTAWNKVNDTDYPF